MEKEWQKNQIKVNRGRESSWLGAYSGRFLDENNLTTLPSGIFDQLILLDYLWVHNHKEQIEKERRFEHVFG